MGYVKTKHNKLISEFIVDPNYFIARNGEIFNINGDRLGYIMKSEKDLRAKQYRYIRYKGKAIKIHRIIYAKYKGPLLPGKIIHHIDDNSLNNDESNLEQTTQKKNCYYTHNKSVDPCVNNVIVDLTDEVNDENI